MRLGKTYCGFGDMAQSLSMNSEYEMPNKRHQGDRFSAASRLQTGACAGRYASLGDIGVQQKCSSLWLCGFSFCRRAGSYLAFTLGMAKVQPVSNGDAG